MDFGFFQTPQIKTLLALVSISVLVAALDSIRRRKSRLGLVKRTVVVKPIESLELKTTAPPAASEAISKAIMPLEPVAMAPPGVRITVPSLPFAGLLRLPQPSPRLLRNSAPLKAYGFVLK